VAKAAAPIAEQALSAEALETQNQMNLTNTAPETSLS
jgi:hypothetical protein